MWYYFEVVTSIKYLMMKFTTSSGVGIVHERQDEAKVYLATVEEHMAGEEEVNPEVMVVRDEERQVRTKLVDKLETFSLLELEKDKVFSLNLAN